MQISCFSPWDVEEEATSACTAPPEAEDEGLNANLRGHHRNQSFEGADLEQTRHPSSRRLPHYAIV